MCAICGVLNWKGCPAIRREDVEKMLKALRHRGPDGSRSLLLEGAALGFNRLSFVDLSGGMQPLQNEDETISMICNGEIFNFQELRRELEEKGHRSARKRMWK